MKRLILTLSLVLTPLAHAESRDVFDYCEGIAQAAEDFTPFLKEGNSPTSITELIYNRNDISADRKTTLNVGMLMSSAILKRDGSVTAERIFYRTIKSCVNSEYNTLSKKAKGVAI